MEIHEPRSKSHFYALEQTRRLRPLEGSREKYLFLSLLLVPKYTVIKVGAVWLHCAAAAAVAPPPRQRRPRAAAAAAAARGAR